MPSANSQFLIRKNPLVESSRLHRFNVVDMQKRNRVQFNNFVEHRIASLSFSYANAKLVSELVRVFEISANSSTVKCKVKHKEETHY